MTKTTAAAVAVAAAAVVSAPLAWADDVAGTTAALGQAAQLVNGSTVQGWTITDLKPSTDVIPYAANGTLWEATATDEALQGGATPIVSNLNARAADGQNYRVLFGVATPQGVNPATLAQGQKTTGKVYFDVTGPAPQSVVYNAGSHDLLTWQGASTAAPAAAPTAGSARAAAPASASAGA
ncbi:MAG: MPT63 family protein, partial [Mycobacterium sp.]